MLRPAKTPAQRSRLIQRWRASGLPLARFARRHHIHPRTFWGWARDASGPAVDAPTFVPVHVVDAPAALGDVARPSHSLAVLEIILPSGPRLRLAAGVSPAWVAAIIKGLHTRC